jgi:competence protein ComEC
MTQLRLSKRTAALLSLVVIAVYTLFVGASAAVTRAALMSALLVIGKALKRKTYIPTSLAFAAILLSILNPFTLWDVGFQLSFAAVFSIALFADPLSSRFDRLLKRRLPANTADKVSGLLNEPLIVSLTAIIGTLPITILYFGHVSLVALFVNLLIVPVQPLVLILGGLATILAFTSSTLGILLFAPVFVLLSWTVSIVRAFADLPFASLEAALHPNAVAAIFGVWLAAAILRATKPNWAERLWIWLRARKLISALLFVLICAAALGIAYLRSLPDGRLHVWILDMGHSHAVLIQSPNGAQMLIDGGRFPSRLLTAIGDRMPFYDRHIEVLAITHPDENDFSALSEVLDRYDVGAAIYHGQPNLGDRWTGLQEHLPLTIVGRGTTFALDNSVTVEILHPPSAPAITDNFGDGMLVIRVGYGTTSFLFTSDMSLEAQTTLLEAGVPLASTLLVMPKHGAEDSLDPAFLSVVNPQAAAMQADIANPFGDPDPNTLALLGDIPLFRTDLDGTIHITSDGQRLEVVHEN